MRRQRHDEAHEGLLVPELGDVPRVADLRMLSISLSSEWASSTTMTLAIDSSALLQGSLAPPILVSGKRASHPHYARQPTVTLGLSEWRLDAGSVKGNPPARLAMPWGVC